LARIGSALGPNVSEKMHAVKQRGAAITAADAM